LYFRCNLISDSRLWISDDDYIFQGVITNQSMLAVILRRVEPGGIGSFNAETIGTGRHSKRIMAVGARPPSRNFARDLIGDYYHHAGYRRTYFSRNHPALLT